MSLESGPNTAEAAAERKKLNPFLKIALETQLTPVSFRLIGSAYQVIYPSLSESPLTSS